MPLTVLCITSYEKGQDFLRSAKNLGCRVLLITSKSLEDAAWPRESIDEIFYISDVEKEWKMKDLLYGVSYLARTEKIDRIVPLDDFDVERAASLREHLRAPGMGDTTARYFRDKLAMRTRAVEMKIPVPEFVHILNYDYLKDFMNKVSFPFIIKPRMQAGSHGMKKVYNEAEVWKRLNELGDEQSFFLMERFISGNIYHVDSIIYEKEIRFALAHQYAKPPLEVAHEGRVFSSQTMLRGTQDEQKLLKLNEKVLKAMGMVRGVSHTEFIKADSDGKFYFLETSARVGGANISELIEAASGVNLWAEWAKIEVLKGEGEYQLPELKYDYAGLLNSLAKQEYPDLSAYNDPEVYWKLKKKYHAGLIIKSPSLDRINFLLKNYTARFYQDFFTSQPLPEKAGH